MGDPVAIRGVADASNTSSSSDEERAAEQLYRAQHLALLQQIAEQQRATNDLLERQTQALAELVRVLDEYFFEDENEDEHDEDER